MAPTGRLESWTELRSLSSLVQDAGHAELLLTIPETLVPDTQARMREALQLHLEALRLIYRLSDDEVHVVAVAPHARSMQSLLQRRMLEA